MAPVRFLLGTFHGRAVGSPVLGLSAIRAKVSILAFTRRKGASRGFVKISTNWYFLRFVVIPHVALNATRDVPQEGIVSAPRERVETTPFTKRLLVGKDRLEGIGLKIGCRKRRKQVLVE